MPKSSGLLTYKRAKELIDEYRHCPYCKKSDGLIAVRKDSFPPGKKWQSYWRASSDEIVCLNCNVVWALERLFIESFKEAKNG